MKTGWQLIFKFKQYKMQTLVTSLAGDKLSIYTEDPIGSQIEVLNWGRNWKLLPAEQMQIYYCHDALS